jgi:hypothetical protein
MLVSGESEKELARARKVMGSEWVVELNKRYVYLRSSSDFRRTTLFLHHRRALSRAWAAELDFTNGGNEEEIMCPVCHESTPLLHLPVLSFN